MKEVGVTLARDHHYWTNATYVPLLKTDGESVTMLFVKDRII